MKIRKKFKLYFLFFLFFVIVAIFYSLYRVSSRELLTAFLDVGQGDAIFIQAPGGKQILIDGGPNLSVLREVGRVMPFFDRSIDVVIATHADQDHIGGLIEVLKRYEVGLFIRTNATATSAVYLELDNLIQTKKIKTEIIKSPVTMTLGAGVKLDIIFPLLDTTGWETNDASIVSRLVYGKNSFLLMGDAPQKVEKYLVQKYGNFLDSDILKAGHHGSKNSNAESFIQLVSPEYSIISAGLNNRYGHPAPEVLNLLSQFQDKILQTMDSGTLIFKTNGEKLRLIN